MSAKTISGNLSRKNASFVGGLLSGRDASGSIIASSSSTQFSLLSGRSIAGINNSTNSSLSSVLTIDRFVYCTVNFSDVTIINSQNIDSTIVTGTYISKDIFSGISYVE